MSESEKRLAALFGNKNLASRSYWQRNCLCVVRHHYCLKVILKDKRLCQYSNINVKNVDTKWIAWKRVPAKVNIFVKSVEVLRCRNYFQVFLLARVIGQVALAQQVHARFLKQEQLWSMLEEIIKTSPVYMRICKTVVILSMR